MQTRIYGRSREVLEIPDLMELQTKSYVEFLQAEIPYPERKNTGLEAILREVYPIQSFDGTRSLEYLYYELGQPRYSPDECRRLRLTYGMPFRIRVKLEGPEPVEEEVYLGEIPIMIGGGEFIVNGAERVIVTQLHRSPGVDFSVEIHAGERKLHSCWIIPERGSWIEVNVGKKDSLHVRIDQSGKFPCTSLLRALSPEYSTDADLLRLFYPTEVLKKSALKGKASLEGRIPVADVVDKSTGEVIAEALLPLTEAQAATVAESNLDEMGSSATSTTA